MEDHEYQHTDVDTDMEHEDTDVITCPYCGYEYEYQESRKMIGNTSNAWRFYAECKKCSKCFSVGWDFGEDEEGAPGDDDDYIKFWTYHENQAEFVPYRLP